MMAMPAVCFNDEDFYQEVLPIIKKLVPTVEQIISVSDQENAYQVVLQLAKKHTGRNKILILENPIIFDEIISNSQDENVKIIPADDAALLCETIANSAERIAAIMVKHDKASTYYYKKVRELSSAEGAVMIWDNLHQRNIKADTSLNMSKKSFPDLICFNLNTVWIGGRSELLSLISNQQYQLPNGQLIYHKNNYETDYVYNEIFNEQIYLQHGINIKNNAVIFDIGANIGLFSLYIKQNYPSSKIYAFEPSPDIFTILNLNVGVFDNSIKTYNVGLSDDDKESVFYYYPDFTVISGFNANQERDAEIITSGIKCNAQHEIASVTQLINKRLEKLVPYKCQVKTLSNIIEQEHITEIDLLKLDVEGSELAILKGIAEQDWFKVKQIVMEVHHKNDLETICDLLRNKLFTITVAADKRLENAGIYNLYARR